MSEDVVLTPEVPKKLDIRFDLSGKPFKAEGDIIFVHANLIDKNGTTVVNDNSTIVEFKIEGPATLAGPAKVDAETGIATIMIRSTQQSGKVKIFATTSNGLKGKAVIHSK